MLHDLLQMVVRWVERQRLQVLPAAWMQAVDLVRQSPGAVDKYGIFLKDLLENIPDCLLILIGKLSQNLVLNPGWSGRLTRTPDNLLTLPG